MDVSQLYLTCLVILSGALTTQAQHHVNEGNLQTALLASYKVDVRPDTSVTVSITPVPLSLNSLDIRQQSMSLTAIYIITWMDNRLTWNPASYGNINDLVLPCEKIWTPSLVVENAVTNVGRIGGVTQDNTPLRIRQDGNVTWYPPLETTTSCEMKISKYPFDTQTCFVTLSSWGFSTAETTLSYADMNWTYYSDNGEWDLRSHWTSTGEFSDGINYFTRLNIYFTFRRKWQFYTQNLILPIVLTSVLTCAIFVLPVDSGEKMGYALTVLLSYAVFLSWVTDTVPSISNDTSVLQVYLAIVLILGVMATVLTVWVVHLHQRPPTYPMPRPMRFTVRYLLLPLWNFTCCSRSRVKGLNSVQVRPQTARSDSDGDPCSESVDEGFGSKTKTVSMGSVKKADLVAEELDKKTEEPPSWPEVAVMFDWLFFMLYMMMKPILTIVMLIILYVDY